MAEKTFYRRHLPHWLPPGSIIFTTFRTAGSLPKHVEKELVSRASKLHTLLHGQLNPPASLVIEHRKLFKFLDDHLHATCLAKDWTCILGSEAAAACVVRSIREGQELGQYLLHRYCVMPNHVHLLIEPLPSGPRLKNVKAQWPPLWFTDAERAMLAGHVDASQVTWWKLSRILQSLKGSTSRRISEATGAPKPVWQDESFDHWIRDSESYERVVKYIDRNPVSAGLCTDAASWPWSSVGENCRL